MRRRSMSRSRSGLPAPAPGRAGPIHGNVVARCDSSAMLTEHAVDADGLYRVTAHKRRGWGWQCLCGWRSPLYESAAEAMEGFKGHVESPPPPMSWREKRAQRRWHGILDRRRR